MRIIIFSGFNIHLKDEDNVYLPPIGPPKKTMLRENGHGHECGQR